MNYQKLAFWLNRHRLIILVVGVLFLITAVPTYAEYKPRKRKPVSGHSRGGGSRGCSSNSIPLTLLAPKTFIGETASKRPMFAWYMSNSQNVRFRLFEFESATETKQIGESKKIPTTVGINKLKLPPEYPELTVGKRYLWQIAIDCRNETIIKRTEFDVVNLPSIANKKFTNIPESVDYYAENGLWYEALEEALKEEVLKAADNCKLGRTGWSLVQDLTKLEEEMLTQPGNDIKKRIESLQKIVGICMIQNDSKLRDSKPTRGNSSRAGGSSR